MDSLQSARQLADSGRFTDALEVLRQGPIGSDARLAADVLLADLSERVGRIGQSRAMLATLLRSRDLSDSQRSVCEYVLSRIGSSGKSVGEILTALVFEEPAEFAAGGFEGTALCF